VEILEGCSLHVDLTGMPFMEACDKNIAIIGKKKI
jgi:hypothetical protein